MKNDLLLALAFITLFVSCQNEDGIYKTGVMESSLNPNLRIERKMSTKALEFVNGLFLETRNYDNDLSVASVYPWRLCEMFPQTRGESSPGNSNDTLLYIVNFDGNNGFALVSAKESFDGVVAYVEKGNLRPDDEIDNPGFQLFLGLMPQFLSSSLHPIDSLLNEDNPFSPPLPDPEPYDTVSHDIWYITDFYAPLLTTEWGQYYPYNYLCYTENGDRAVAGCSPIATSQIVAYHQKPLSYSGHTYQWNDILSGTSPQNYNGKMSVAELVSDIGQLLGTQYGMLNSSTYTDSVKNCWEAFGYNYQLQPFNVDSCFADFQNGRPVFMRGTGIVTESYRVGHAWVIDGGFTKYEYIICNPSANSHFESQKFIHCNWGWDGDDNGYYIAGAFGTKYDSQGLNPTSAYPFFNIFLRTYNKVFPLNQ